MKFRSDVYLSLDEVFVKLACFYGFYLWGDVLRYYCCTLCQLFPCHLKKKYKKKKKKRRKKHWVLEETSRNDWNIIMDYWCSI